MNTILCVIAAFFIRKAILETWSIRSFNWILDQNENYAEEIRHAETPERAHQMVFAILQKRFPELGEEYFQKERRIFRLSARHLHEITEIIYLDSMQEASFL